MTVDKQEQMACTVRTCARGPASARSSTPEARGESEPDAHVELLGRFWL